MSGRTVIQVGLYLGPGGEGGLITGVRGTTSPALPGLPQSPCISQPSPLHSILK